ncbi:pyrimidodiazepine synthase-like [Schistocerca nitens]|uniref:pyrimidodiazepine synthase-like n=1 Tax=Schistocerca nitens TaxID=7011 RepID=UPI002117FEF9|nr:pyrimidodiazepine synthase-like [Schistocerca nitens]
MSQKHLSRGSRLPPFPKGKLRLFSMRFCPYAQRVHLVLDAKRIPYDVVNVDLTEKPDWLYEKSPFGKVPAIELESGDTLYESLIICDFLDEKYPSRSLYSRDPLKKAKDKIMIDHFNKVIQSMLKVYYHTANSNLNEDQLEEFFQGLDLYERELVERGKPFFGGDRPGMLDYMIWPWCERSDMMKVLGGDQFLLPRDRFKRLMEWRNQMKEDEAVKESYLEPQVHAKYFQSRKAGYPDYDMLVIN